MDGQSTVPAVESHNLSLHLPANKKVHTQVLGVVAIMLFSQQPVVPVMEGVASYYNVRSSSRLTASGEPMVDEAFTCAMRTGVFGAHYRITAENGRSVVCRLNDRGPYVKGRIIDLSEGAMRVLDPSIRKGLLRVRIERIPEISVPRLFGPTN